MKVLLVNADSKGDPEVVRLLHQQGHRVTLCATLAAAEAVLEREPFPLLILRLSNTERSDDFCQRLRKLPDGEQTFVLALPTPDCQGAVSDLLAAGVDDFLPDLSDLDSFRNRLRLAERLAGRFLPGGNGSYGSCGRGRNGNARAHADQRYQTLFEASTDASYVADSTGTILEANAAALALFGISREQLPVPWTELFVEAGDRMQVMAALRQDGKVQDLEVQLRTASDTVMDCLLTATLTRQANGKISGHQGTVRDVTGRKAVAALESHHVKMEAVQRLSGGIAHDFNNLLTVIIGYANILNAGVAGDPALTHATDEIMTAARRATNLTKRLLTISRKQVLHAEALDLNETIQALSSRIEELVGPEIECAVSLRADLATVSGDREQLTEVVLALVSNACDAMPGGGKLTIETGIVELDETYASRHDAVAPGRYVMLAISDTGEGIEDAAKPYIFDPFFTTREFGRSGLGLSTVYGIVKQSSGSVLVYSEKGRGTTFKIYLPQLDEAVSAPALPAIRQHDAPTDTGTILLVEDEHTLRHLVEQVLAEAGYTVISAADGADALAKAHRFQGHIDLILTDIVMPKVDGPQLAEAMRKRRPRPCVLFMSGYTKDAVTHQGILATRDHFLQKPFTPSALLAKIRHVLAGDETHYQ